MTSLINILLLLHPTVVTDAQLVEQIKLKIYQSHNNNNKQQWWHYNDDNRNSEYQS